MFLRVCFPLLLVCVVTACPGVSYGNTIPFPLRVGVFQNAPVVFQNDRHSAEGLYVDLLNEIARQEGWQVDYVLSSWGSNLRKLQGGHIDLVTSIAKTPEREKYLDYSKESVVTIWGQVYAHQSRDIMTVLDLEGKRVSVLRGGINGQSFKELCKEFGVTPEIVEKESYDEVYAAAENGDVDACVVNNVNGAHFENVYQVEKTPIMFAPFSLLFATPKGKSDILPIIDRYIAQWKGEPNSVYATAKKKWLEGGEESGVPAWILIGVGFFSIVIILVATTFISGRRRKRRVR